MMIAVTKRPATYEDIVALPEHVVGEILDGELYVQPRPASLHTRASSILGVALGGPFDLGAGGPGGWLILDEPELHFGRDVLVPDLAGWRRAKMPEMPNISAFTLAPDWICEVLSPSTAKLDRTKKLDAYAREGVGFLWLIDPLLRTLEIMRLEQGRWLLASTHVDDARVRAEPFDAIELDLAAVFSR